MFPRTFHPALNLIIFFAEIYVHNKFLFKIKYFFVQKKITRLQRRDEEPFWYLNISSAKLFTASQASRGHNDSRSQSIIND